MSWCFCVGVCLLLAAGASAADVPSATAETRAEKLRKALDQVRDLELTDQPLDVAVNHLREQTGINFVIDQANVMGVPPLLGGQLPGTGINPMVAAPYAHLRIGGQFHGLPVRAAVAKMLRKHGLTHVLVGDTVLVTTADKAIERQLRQPVSVKAEGTALADVLKRLARDTGANLVLDPQSAKAGRAELTVRLDEVALESAVEVVAADAGLGVARLGNVLYVTSEARAEKLRKSQTTAATAPPGGGWQVWPDGKGGFNLTPPAGVGIVGLCGFNGMTNLGAIGGLGGIAGLGGGRNLMGAGGGVAGLAGGQPVPLTPPLPKAKPRSDKPRDAKPAPPAKPAAAPAGKDKPAPADKPQPQAIRPRSGTTRSRRRLPGGSLT